MEVQFLHIIQLYIRGASNAGGEGEKRGRGGLDLPCSFVKIEKSVLIIWGKCSNCGKWNVYRSAFYPKNLLCPEKFLVAILYMHNDYYIKCMCEERRYTLKVDVGETMRFESLSKGWVWSLGDIVKHVLQVMSYKLQAACLEARVESLKSRSWNSKVRVHIHELGVQIHESLSQ